MSALDDEYRASLDTFLHTRDEVARSAGYELGRRALESGIGVLDVVSMHQEALIALIGHSALEERTRFVRAGVDFLREVLSPFEMSLRGYREANDSLQALNRALEEKNEAVNAVNRELESFSYSVSHDLRAPLRAIDGFSQALLEDYAPKLDDAGKKYLRYVREAAQNMAQLIDDLLSFSRVGRSELQRQPIDLAKIVRRVVDRLMMVPGARQVELVMAEPLWADADPKLVTIVFDNLLSNAWKFSSRSEKPRVEVGETQSRGVRAFFVRDNGAGFDMAYAHKLFGVFQRLHSPSEFEGTGIGLATVQRIVHRHGGDVWAEGVVGQGATFYFTLAGAA